MPESTDNNATEIDDWAAAMAEQAEVEGNATEKAIGTDDWGAAMAEQEADNTAKSSNSGGKNGTLDTKNGATSVFQEFSRGGSNHGAPHDIDMILDIPVQMTVELGRTRIAIKNLLQLAQGSVVELDGMAGEPMDVLVNGCLIAQGEVVVVNDKFGIRLTDIITPSERIRKLNR
ncbi:MAG: flagellar motor switch protein FliN [Nitrosomonas sp.]